MDADDNIYIAGVFDDYRDFDPGPDTVQLTASGGWDIFVLKWNATGEFIWVRHLGSLNGDNWAHDMVMTKDEDLLATGHFTGTIDFDTDPGTFEMTATNSDPYIWKLTNDGQFIWSLQFGGVSFDQGRDVSLDEFGNIYSTGWFGDVSDFDPGPGNYTLTSTGSNDLDDGYITKLSPDGHFIWAYKLGGYSDDSGREAKVDRFGNIFITGMFQSNAAVHPGGQTSDSLTSNGAADPFLVRWRQCAQTFGEISAVTCDTYTSPSGNHTWDASGDYTDTLTNVSGCDSILTIHLSVTTINTTVTLIFNVGLEAEMEGAIYQWVDCNQGYAEIPEATEQFFSAVASGLYAVIISDGVCVDTSACVNVIIAGTDVQDQDSGIHIYPNPAHQNWFVQIADYTGEIKIEVVDLWGRKRFYDVYTGANQIAMDDDLLPGIYLVSVIAGDRQRIVKLNLY